MSFVVGVKSVGGEFVAAVGFGNGETVVIKVDIIHSVHNAKRPDYIHVTFKRQSRFTATAAA